MDLIKLFYNNYECSVLLKNKFGDWFSVETRVRQGCILSPILFLITIDCVLRQTNDRPRGIQWTLLKHLEDLDFADPPSFLGSQIEQIFWCLSARVRKIIMDNYPQKVFFCFYKGVCTWSCEDNPGLARCRIK